MAEPLDPDLLLVLRDACNEMLDQIDRGESKPWNDYIGPHDTMLDRAGYLNVLDRARSLVSRAFNGSLPEDIHMARPNGPVVIRWVEWPPGGHTTLLRFPSGALVLIDADAAKAIRYETFDGSVGLVERLAFDRFTEVSREVRDRLSDDDVVQLKGGEG